MTPDDRDGRLLARLLVLYDDARNGTPVTDPNEHDADELAEIITDLRALLLDYQERGRALEEAERRSVVVALKALTDRVDAALSLNKWPSPDDLALLQQVTDWWAVARATLKGKSHE